MVIYTIGFRGKTASAFFEALKAKKIERLLDVRLNNTSQLASFTKKPDLEYFLTEVLGAEYHHVTILAPTQELLDKFKEDKDWEYYETEYGRLLDERRLSENLDLKLFDRDIVLLCSEETADRCHRRLAAEYISRLLPYVNIEHL
jgi:uncharacterized protein (DUF488 family)